MATPQRFDFDAFIRVIDASPVLKDIPVVYFDGVHHHVIRKARPSSNPSRDVVLIRAPVEATAQTTAAGARSRDGKLAMEILGGILGCGAATLSWIAVAGSASAAPITGGASSFITALSFTAATASSLQCANSAARIVGELYAPETNDWLDSQSWYVQTATVVDVISIAGAGAASAATVKLVLTLRRTTGKSTLDVLKGLNRQQRKALTEEAIALQNPGIGRKQVKAMVALGVYPKRYTQVQIGEAVRRQIVDALAAALSFAGSGSAGSLRQGGGYVVGLVRPIETQ